MNVCQRNVARFDHVECMFDKINDIFLGFGNLLSLRLQKDGRARSKQIWANLSHWNTDGLSYAFLALHIALPLLIICTLYFKSYKRIANHFCHVAGYIRELLLHPIV